MTNTRFRNIYLDNCSHFCTSSIVGRTPILADDNARMKLINCWQKHRIKYSVFIEGFVIMPEHIHLLIRGSADGVRKFIQYTLADSSRELRLMLNLRAKSGDAQAAHWLQIIESRANGEASGKVWKERFRCVPLDQEDAVLDKLKYIHNNPVKRYLVTHPGEWAWSSYGYYHDGDCLLPIDSVFSCGNS